MAIASLRRVTRLSLLLATAAPTTFLLTSLAPRTAHAQMSEGEKKAAARAAYQEGIRLQESGNATDALAKFQAAQALFDAPTHLLHVAQCQTLLGRLVEASETYEKIIRKPLPAGSPEAFVRAQEQARSEGPAVRERTPSLKILVKPSADKLRGLSITVNGKQVPAELVGITRPVNPGSYSLSAAAEGWATPAAVEATLAEKETKTVELSLRQGAPGSLVAGGAAPPPQGGQGAWGQQGQPQGGYQNVPPPGQGQGQGQQGGSPYVYTSGDDAARADRLAATNVDKGTSTGLLFGVHAGYVGLGSSAYEYDASSGRGINRDFGGGGGQFGIDFKFRFARILHVGLLFDYLSVSPGGPDSSEIASGRSIQASMNSTAIGALVGLVTSPKKFAFYCDLGVVNRRFSYKEQLSTGVTFFERTESGAMFTTHVGFAIPMGPLRLIPVVGLEAGSFQGKPAAIGSVGANLFYDLPFGAKKPAQVAAAR